MTWRRRAVYVAAVLAVPLALALAFLAVDVLRTPGTLERDDVRFEAAPKRPAGLWGDTAIASGAVESLLDLGDDLGTGGPWPHSCGSSPGRWRFSGRSSRICSGEVQLEAHAWERGGRKPATSCAVPQSSRDEDARQLRRRPDRGGHDPAARHPHAPERRGNRSRDADAKLNLELALRNAKAVNLPGTDPSGDAASGTISGQGRSGTGY